jgi:hypothetical protein
MAKKFTVIPIFHFNFLMRNCNLLLEFFYHVPFFKAKDMGLVESDKNPSIIMVVLVLLLIPEADSELASSWMISLLALADLGKLRADVS